MIHEWNRLFKKRMIWIGIILLVPSVLFAAGLSAFEQTDIIPFYTSLENNKNTVPESFDNKMSAPEDNGNSGTPANYLLKDNEAKKEDQFFFRGSGGGSNQIRGNHQNSGSQETDENNDKDNDEVNDDSDNCPDVSNHDQEDSDTDGYGNACDDDDDGTSIPEFPSIALPVIATIGLLFVLRRSN